MSPIIDNDDAWVGPGLVAGAAPWVRFAHFFRPGSFGFGPKVRLGPGNGHSRESGWRRWCENEPKSRRNREGGIRGLGRGFVQTGHRGFREQ